MPEIINDCAKENTFFLEVNGKCRNLSKVVSHFEICCEQVNKEIKYLQEKILQLTKQVHIVYKPEPSITITYVPISSTKIIYNIVPNRTAERIPDGRYYDSRHLYNNKPSDTIQPKNIEYYNDRYKNMRKIK